MRSSLSPLLALGLASLACSAPPIAEGRFACQESSECPPGWVCRADRRCYRAPADGGALDGRAGACGDRACGPNENCESCPGDCGSCAGCGDGRCASPGESCASCPADCGACPATCGDGVCATGESCGQCTECWIGHLGTGNDGDPCDRSLEDQWRCVRSSRQGNAWVSQSCQDNNGGWYWLTFGVEPRDCQACVCGMSPACCREGSMQNGCQ